eukprot:16448853-Heterocapsa_arctica.AAC.1
MCCYDAATIVDAVIQTSKLLSCLSGRVFRASINVCACGSRPTKFPGTWRALDERLACALRALCKRFASAFNCLFFVFVDA